MTAAPALAPSVPVPTDAELVALVRTGNRNAADALVRRHAPMVGDLVGKARPPANVELDDLAQAGLIALYRCAFGWEPGAAKFSTYAYAAVRNAISREVERQQHPTTSGELLTDEPPESPVEDAPEPTPPDLSSALAALPLLHRLLLMSYFGLGGQPDPRAGRKWAKQREPYVTVGRRFGLSRGQCRHLVNDALRRLRNTLLAAGYDPL